MDKRSLISSFVLSLMLLFAGAVAPAEAQAQEFGYIFEQALVVNMPEYANVQQQLEQRTTDLLGPEYRQLQEKQQQYQSGAGAMTESARQQLGTEIATLGQQLQAKAAEIGLQQQIAQYEQQLMQPLYQELNGAIEAVAQEQDLKMVLRFETLAYADESSVVNITPAVATRLGIEVQETPPASDAGLSSGQ